jgi:hypothetical protein
MQKGASYFQKVGGLKINIGSKIWAKPFRYLACSLIEILSSGRVRLSALGPFRIGIYKLISTRFLFKYL